MSLKFGIYLVEQRIVSPEQFCGLVKIQQEALSSMATVAIRKNMLTIKQVANILDIQDASPAKSFCSIAIECDYMDAADVQQLLHEQQMARLSIRKLVVECGLLTDRQANVLQQHFEKIGTRKTSEEKVAATPRPVEAREESAAEDIRSMPVPVPMGQIGQMPMEQMPLETPMAEAPVANRAPIRQPKFRQRPVIVHPYSSTVE